METNFSLTDVNIKSTLPVGTHEVVLEAVDHCLHTGTATLTVEVTDDVSTCLIFVCFLKFSLK